VAIDYFGAGGRAELEKLLATAEEKLRPPRGDAPKTVPDVPPFRNLRGRTWVTRKGIHVDRIASAWLIRRFIDTAAKLKYVEAKGYAPAPGELRFDMFDAEFTHEGDRCSFEVLLARFGLRDAGLRAIAEIVHDIDLKDSKFGREETAGIGHLLTGVCAPGRGDDQRIARSAAIFNDLYDWFAGAHR
jgi:hypothetical protein